MDMVKQSGWPMDGIIGHLVIPCHTLSYIVGHAPTHNMECMMWTMDDAHMGQQLRHHAHGDVIWLEYTAFHGPASACHH